MHTREPCVHLMFKVKKIKVKFFICIIINYNYMHYISRRKKWGAFK